MIWGLYETNSFGAYRPDGDFAGWELQLKHHFLDEMSDQEQQSYGTHGYMSYFSHTKKKFLEEPGYTIDGLPPIGPMQAHEVPEEFAIEKKPSGELSALITLNRVPAVNEELKAAIEALEPGVHEFWPIRLTLPKGGEWPVQYYTMRIGRFLDSFRPEESDEGAWRKRGVKTDRYYVSIPKKEYFAELGMSRAEIGDAHLWRERRLGRPEICMSNEMQAVLKKTGLKGSKLYRLKDVP